MPLQIIHAQETFFFSQEAQWVELTLQNDAPAATRARVVIRAGDQQMSTPLELQAGQHTYKVHAPIVWPKPPVAAHLTLQADEGSQAATFPLGHQRPWVVYLLSDACTDYTWVYADEASMRADDAALMKAELEGGTHYNLVHSRQVEFFLEHYPEQEKTLMQTFRQGRFTLNPVMSMTLFSLMSVEEILRSFYGARRLAHQHELDDHYANIQETPTTPWILPTLLAGSGTAHLVRSLLPYECPWVRRLQEPPVYFWEGPDGSRILVRLRKEDYVEGAFVTRGLAETNQALHERILPAYSGQPDYPFNAIALVGCYGDLAANSKDLPALKAATIAAYNAQGWEYPRLVDAAHKDFWDDIERQSASGTFSIPVYRGDYGLSWEAWPASLAVELAGWRRLQVQSLAADRLGTIASIHSPEWFKPHQVHLDEGWDNLLYLADHAWNGANDANRQLNLALRRQWLQAGSKNFTTFTNGSLNALASQVRSPQDGVLVFNPLSWTASGVIRLSGDALPASLIDPATQEEVPVQISREDGMQTGTFVAQGLPSVGYKVFQTGHSAATSLVQTTALHAETIESPFYTLRIDPLSGAVKSLFDKTRQHELVDPASQFGINEPVYAVTTQDKQGEYPVFTHADFSGAVEHRSRRVACEVTARGPVFSELKVTMTVEQISISTTYRLYHAIDRLEIENQVEKPVSALKQELDFVFPFHIPNPEVRFEAPGILLDPDRDQLPGSGRAVNAVRHLVDLFNTQAGVRLSLIDSPYFQFGQRTTTEDPLKRPSSNATLYCMVMDNVFDWGEATRNQGGSTRFVFRFALQGHAGGDFSPIDGLHFGYAANAYFQTAPVTPNPQGSLPAGQHSFVNVSPHNILLTGLKPAEGEGLAFRLWECAGQDTTAHIDLNGLGAIHQAVLTDLLESPLAPLAFKEGSLSLPVKKHGLAAGKVSFTTQK